MPYFMAMVFTYHLVELRRSQKKIYEGKDESRRAGRQVGTKKSRIEIQPRVKSNIL
jgi:hypothetical protein